MWPPRLVVDDVRVLAFVGLEAVRPQSATGLYMGIFIRGAPLWYLYTAVLYFHSLLCSTRRSSTWPTSLWCSSCTRRGRSCIIALLPFTKLVHLLFLPIDFLKDPPFCIAGGLRSPGTRVTRRNFTRGAIRWHLAC